MRRSLLLMAVALTLGGVGGILVVGLASTGGAPPVVPLSPAAPAANAGLPRHEVGLWSGATFEMVLAPAGEFDMRSPATEEGREDDEALHRLRVTRSHRLARTEVSPAAQGVRAPSWARVAPEQVEAAEMAGVPVAFENSMGMRFVLIPAGTFLMGSPETEDGRGSDETLHQVTIALPYYMGTTEVTNAQYRQFKPDHDSGTCEGNSLNGDEQPVVQVSWGDATAFLWWLSARDSRRRYRLPSEAEWERACRAGTQTPFSWGSQIDTRQANCDGSFAHGGSGTGVYRRTTVPVGTLPANPWGLHEMHGNAWEWCADWYTPCPQAGARDLAGPASGSARVLRGGAWFDCPDALRSANRRRVTPDYRTNRFGFRVAVSAAPR